MVHGARSRSSASRLRAAALRLAIAWALAAAGCDEAPTAPSGRAQIQLTSEVSRPVIGPGEETVVVFRAENTGLRDVVLTSPTACLILPTISDRRTGRVVYPATPWACATVVTTRRLLPGEVEWVDVRIRAASAVPFLYVPLGPGDYQVQATLRTLETELRWEAVPISVR